MEKGQKTPRQRPIRHLLGHPTDLKPKGGGESSMLGKRLSRKGCRVMHRKSCTYGEA